MALIPAEVRTALKLLNSIDISLGRIATALEKRNEIESTSSKIVPTNIEVSEGGVHLMELGKYFFDTKQEAQDYILEHNLKNKRVCHKKGYGFYIHNKQSSDTKAVIFDSVFSKQSYIAIAKQLCYGDDIIKELEKCNNDAEAGRIMATARHKEE